jgi:hypothetical protein
MVGQTRLGVQETDELVNYYSHFIGTEDPAERARFVDGITKQLEKWGYVDRLYDSAVAALTQNATSLELKAKMRESVYPEYRARITSVLSSEDFARNIVRAPNKLVPSMDDRVRKTPYASPAEEEQAKRKDAAAKVRLELFTAVHNTLFKVVQEQADELGLPPVWKRQWSSYTISTNQAIQSGGDEGAGDIEQTLADAPEKSDPAVMYGGVLGNLKSAYSGTPIAEFISELSDGVVSGIGESVDPAEIKAIALPRVTEYANDRALIADPDEVAYWDENLDKIASDIANAIVQAKTSGEYA